MSISNIVLGFTNRCKPVLLKVFPYQFLRKMKGKMIQRSFQKIEQTDIKPFSRENFADGINLIGNIKAETGLGQSCRLVADMLEASGIPYSIYQYDQLGVMTEGHYEKYEEKISKELPYNINLIHINPHELGLAFQQSHQVIWDGRYNIGFWLWELEEFPDEWRPCFHCLNEIWTPSEFISRGIRKKTGLPVTTIPYHISMVTPAGAKESYRQQFGLPKDKCLFLMMYDRTSVSERKNPKAVLAAYQKAFSEKEEYQAVGLVIKINNPTDQEIDMIRAMIPQYHNVYFITDTLGRQEVNELIYCVDAVVSLHRAEGFGLVLAEAMSLGTPTIATNWSSNTEFMNSEVACMVDAELVQIKADIGSFKKGNYWAEPDVEQAAEYMKYLYQNIGYRTGIAQKAKVFIRDCLGLEQIIDQIDSRVKVIYKEN